MAVEMVVTAEVERVLEMEIEDMAGAEEVASAKVELGGVEGSQCDTPPAQQ